MKLIGVFLLFCLHVSAGGYTQDKVTLNMESANLKKVLSEIEKTTKYRFLYNEALFNNKSRVDIHVTDADITAVLNTIFAGRNIGYEMLENNLIVLKTAMTGARIQVQQVQVSGRVTGQYGEALAGVSVSVKGTSTGTSTDAAGNYTISVPDGTATLVFSYVGYQTQEVAVNGRTEINMSLTSSASQMEQIVVVGYGTQRRRDVTGSVATVSGNELAKQPVLTATQAVQGRVAGVQVISSGAPNALPIVRIRGVGTMLAGADPLYVVDGVITNDIRNINSNDIISMDILKDASATAIYGMRAANGVLIITTKKGRTGRTVVNYDGNVGVREASRLVNMAGPNQYANYVNEANVYYGNGDSVVTNAQLMAGASTDWYDVILKRGMQQNHNVSLSGGSERITYFLSAGFIQDEGIIKTNDFNRFTLRSNNEYKFGTLFRLQTLLSYSRFNLRDVNLDAFNLAYRAAPYVASKVGELYGNTSLSNNIGNPLLNLEKNDTRHLGNRLQGTIAAELKPLSWITFRSSYGVDLDFFRNTDYGYRIANTGPNNIFLTAGGNQLRDRSSLGITQNEATKWVWDNTVTFAKTSGDHNFNFLVGTTAEQFRFNSLVGNRLEVPESRDQWFLNAGLPGSATNSNSGDKWTRNSYLGRLNYSFANKYMFTGTIRADGTSRLPEDNRWGYFPSIGLAWDVAREDFMGSQNTFDALKLRASWGRVGNDGIASNLFFPLATTQNRVYILNGQEYQGITFDDLSNSNLQWETTSEIDFGIDFAFLKNKLSGTFDVYSKKTEDALINILFPGQFVGDLNNQFTTNAASFSNKGVELSLNWAASAGRDFNYNIGGNISYNKNEITGLNGGQALFSGAIGGNQSNITKSDNGQPIGSFFLWEAIGIFQSEAEIDATPHENVRPRIGDLIYRDASGPTGKPDGIIDAFDRVYAGSYQPKFTYGINGGATFKMFDFSLNTYGTAGGKIYNGKKAARVDTRDNIETEVAKNRWTPNNRNTGIPRANLNQLPASTYFLEKGDFFRINNLTIGFTLPESTLSRFKLQNVRLYVTAQNLATFTSYSGFSPEISKSTSTLDQGIELGIYPTTRTFAFGVNLGF